MLTDSRIHLHVWGIRNCDTVRAALKWLEARRVPHTFHDFRTDGLPEDELRRWLATAHGPLLLNQKGAHMYTRIYFLRFPKETVDKPIIYYHTNW